jgi:hypothetical protein
VSFSASGAGSFSAGSCTLTVGGTAGQAKCSSSYTPTATGSQTVSGSYGGDGAHTGSSGSAALTVTKHTTTFTAEADAQVFSDTPAANYGSSTNLKVNGSPIRRSYIRFNVNLPAGAVVTRTTLHVYFSSSSSDLIDINRAASTWSESTINYNNAPALGVIVGEPTAVSTGWNDFGIQPVLPNRQTTYVLNRPSNVELTARSRESVNKPQLVVEWAYPTTTTATIPSTAPTVQALADARVEQANPSTNYATSYLRTNGGSTTAVSSYLRFSVGGFLGRIQSAKLRVYATTSTSDGPAVYSTTNNWTESGINWNNRPPPTSAARDDKGAITKNTWVEFDVTPFVQGNGTYSFLLAGGTGGAVNFASREQTMKPQLIVTLAPGHLEVRSEDITLSYQSTVADLNGDGRDDYLVSRLGELNTHTSLQQADGSFVPTSFTFPQLDRHGCAAGDVNGDSRVDLYCTIGGNRGESLSKSNELWIAQPDGTYVNQASAWGVDDPYGRGRRAVLFDFNKDGLLDLYVANFGPRPDGRRSENMLFQNTGTSFVEEPVGATGPWGTSCAEDVDWDKDGNRDLLVCGSQLHLFHNSAGTGLNLNDSLLGTSSINWPEDATLGDLNGDGLPDLVVVTASELQVRLNRGSGAIFGQVDKSMPLVDAKGVTIGDFTGDGIPDIYVVQGYANGTNADDLLLAGPTWLQVASIQAEVGTGCSVSPIQVAGTPAALVTNGFNVTRGPIQLVSYHAD